MTVFDLADWVEQNRQRLLQECLIAVRYQDIEALADETDDQLRSEIAPLCRTLFDAIEAEQVEPPPDLAAWARRCQSHRGMSLSDLLKVVSALRTGFGEVLARSIEPAQAHTVWQEFFPVFDRIAQYLTDLYTDAIEQILSEHLKETAHLTRSLMRATDEANRALVRLRAIYDALQSLGTTLTDTNEVFARLTGELGRARSARARGSHPVRQHCWTSCTLARFCSPLSSCKRSRSASERWDGRPTVRRSTEPRRRWSNRSSPRPRSPCRMQGCTKRSAN